MTTLPAAGYISNNARTEGEVKQALEDMIAVARQQPGGATAATSTLTIVSGAVTPTTGIHLIDTEGAAATDDLDTINQTNLPDGSLLFIAAANAGRTVVAKHNTGGTGKIVLVGAADLSLIGTDMWLLLKRNGTQWNEVGRFNAPLRIISTLAATLLALESTEAGASIGPILELYRNSASPAANDVGPGIDLYGEDSAGNKELYGRISLVIDDPTSTSEDATIKVEAKIGGTLMEVGRFGSTGRAAEELLEVQTASSSAQIDFVLTNHLSRYRAFKVVITDLIPATDNTDLYLRTSTDGGSTFAATASDYSWSVSLVSDAATAADAGSANSFIRIAANLGNAASESLSGDVTIYNPAGGGVHKLVKFDIVYLNEAASFRRLTGGGRRQSSADIDALRFLMSSGNITSGVFALYGIR